MGPDIAILWQYYGLFDFSSCPYRQRTNYIVRAPERILPFRNVLRTLDRGTWAMLGLSLVACTLAMLILHVMRGRDKGSLVLTTLVPFSIMFQEYFSNWTKQEVFTRGSMLRLLWLFAMVLVAGSFNGNLKVSKRLIWTK